MVLYRMMQWSRRYRLVPIEMLMNRLNSICCNCIIGRGAEFGPGFVLIHATGVVINGTVVGGENVFIEHQVTIGAEAPAEPPGSATTCSSARAPKSSARSRSATIRESAQTRSCWTTFRLMPPSPASLRGSSRRRAADLEEVAG